MTGSQAQRRAERGKTDRLGPHSKPHAMHHIDNALARHAHLARAREMLRRLEAGNAGPDDCVEHAERAYLEALDGVLARIDEPPRTANEWEPAPEHWDEPGTPDEAHEQAPPATLWVPVLEPDDQSPWIETSAEQGLSALIACVERAMAWLDPNTKHVVLIAPFAPPR